MLAPRRWFRPSLEDLMAYPRYSVILPTYNERENIPLIVWLLVDTFERRCSLHSRRCSTALSATNCCARDMARLPPAPSLSLQRHRL